MNDVDLPGAPVVELDTDGGTLDVSGPGIPHVRLVRAAGARVDPHIPIGTRDPALLTLTVDGVAARILPAKGRISRRSYRVDAAAGGTAYRLVPASYADSRFLKDGRRLGRLDSTGDGTVGAEWHDDATVRPQDVAVGTALAAAFGTGAAPWWETMLDVIADLVP
ncbi:hypothetical protein OHS70_36655 [Streptomyces sp. NBC_00390]|uniref:hypothetical protein n=1 Tax=Streptomyces sp. NBC_00390 TaxID=2975736 RepID=UPI002E1EBBCE